MTSQRLSSGIRGLDDILNGGFPVAQMYLVEGDPGAGKTTIGLHFLRAGAQRGERCAYVVLSESEIALRRLARSHGWELDGVDVIESNDQDPASDYTIFHPGEVELGETSRSLFARLDRLKPQRVVIDSLSEVRLIASDALRYRRQLLTLRRFFDARGITALLLDFKSTTDNRQLGGTIHAYSDGEGKGSTFVVRLPLVARVAIAEPSVESAPPVLPALRIVLVEDNDDARVTLRALLELMGNEVDEAVDGLAGLDRIFTARPDVALVDIGLPKLDGYEVARQVRASNDRASPLLVAMTGYGQPEDRHRALEAGFDVHMVKPVSVRELAKVFAGITPRAATSSRAADSR